MIGTRLLKGEQAKTNTQIVNGSFEGGTIKHPDFQQETDGVYIPNGWGISVTRSGTASAYAYTSTGYATDGAYGFIISVSALGSTRYAHIILSQTIDLTGWNKLIFDVVVISGSIWVKLGGDTVYSSTASSGITEISIDLAATGKSGIVPFEISVGYNYNTATYATSNFAFDNVRLTV